MKGSLLHCLALSCMHLLFSVVFVGVPYTGRMHQIRVHLQWLGYPIINDPIYNHESWGPHRGRAGVSDQLVHKVSSGEDVFIQERVAY